MGAAMPHVDRGLGVPVLIWGRITLGAPVLNKAPAADMYNPYKTVEVRARVHVRVHGDGNSPAAQGLARIGVG